MRPRERRESGQRDLFRARLDQIVDLKHPLAKLADVIDWGFLEKTFGAVYADGPGHPPLPTRLWDWPSAILISTGFCGCGLSDRHSCSCIVSAG